MKQFIVSLLLLLTATSILVAQTKGKQNSTAGAEPELLKVNKEYDEALVRGDTSALDRIFGKEFIYTSTACS